MPWKELSAMEQRMRFVMAVESEETSIAELCRQFGISRVTGYKWIERYRAEGVRGLEDQSRAPLHHPNAVSEHALEIVMALRERYPTWGPKKLRAWLDRHEPQIKWPAESTIGEILHDFGLSRSRKRVRRPGAVLSPVVHYGQPNAVWCVDFKGRFVTGDGRRCEPLTITDGYSRYLLRCQALDTTTREKVQPYFEMTFREFGLPQAILSDNGTPFAASSYLRLSCLAVWWIKLGIKPLRTRPASPQENGRHERFHLTLKRETAMPPQATLRLQQACFERFRHYYNHERPHEALGQTPPATQYAPSSRAFSPKRTPIEYDADWTPRKVYHNGCIAWGTKLVFISETLANEYVALRALPIEPFYVIRFASEDIAFFDAEKKTVLNKLPKSARLLLAQHPRENGRHEHQ
jgi:putative transposase